jgi:iron complex outermembrane receptor protein
MGDGDFNASVGATYVDSTFTDIMQTVKLPSYMIWNGSVGYSTGSISVLAKVNNLLDEEYYTSADLFDSVVVREFKSQVQRSPTQPDVALQTLL